jgi:hypothetical protein
MLVRAAFDTDEWLLMPRIPTIPMLRVVSQPLHPVDYLLGQDLRSRGKLALPRIYHLEAAAGQYVRMVSLVPAGPTLTTVDRRFEG